MKIRYTLTKLDLLIANIYATFRSKFLWILWAGLTVFVAYSWLTDGKYDHKGLGYKIYLIVFLAAVYFLVLFSVVSLLTSLLVLVRKHVGIIGEHILILEDDALVEITDYNESRTKWSAYHRTLITKRYAFLYVSENTLHLVPLRRPLSEGNAIDFLKALREKTS